VCCASCHGARPLSHTDYSWPASDASCVFAQRASGSSRCAPQRSAVLARAAKEDSEEPPTLNFVPSGNASRGYTVREAEERPRARLAVLRCGPAAPRLGGGWRARAAFPTPPASLRTGRARAARCGLTQSRARKRRRATRRGRATFSQWSQRSTWQGAAQTGTPALPPLPPLAARAILPASTDAPAAAAAPTRVLQTSMWRWARPWRSCWACWSRASAARRTTATMDRRHLASTCSFSSGDIALLLCWMRDQLVSSNSSKTLRCSCWLDQQTAR